MAATRINKWEEGGGGGGSLCGMQPFVVIWKHFNVAGRDFEERFLVLEKLRASDYGERVYLVVTVV